MAYCSEIRTYSRRLRNDKELSKYDALKSAVKSLEKINFNLKKIKAMGDSSVHDGIIAPNWYFASINDFITADIRDGEYIPEGDYDYCWNKTWFIFENDEKEIEMHFVVYRRSNSNIDCIIEVRYGYDTDLMNDNEVEEIMDKIADNSYQLLASALNFE